MDILGKIRRAWERGDLIWRVHAQERMSQRNIRREEVRLAVKDGKITKRYESDKPFPSYLVAGAAGKRILHVLVGWDDETGMAYVITVYEPDRLL